MNVLIVLDDVDDLEQLEALAGCHNWFGEGSRIIITTRNEQVLISRRVDEVCPVSLLSHDEAIRLFKKHAYHENNPVEDYEKLSLLMISYVNGLPLALKILGSFLYGKDNNAWMSALDKLKYIPNNKVTDQLKISYDGLDHEEKELFLDIACFHRGTKKDEAMVMLDACGFHPHIGIKVLQQKALISVSEDGKFDMHDLVQEMAHYTVRGEHPYNPEKHSRVWRNSDIEDMCSMNATTENDKIEAISCSNVRSSNFIMLVSNMKKLRFLSVRMLRSSYDKGDEGPSFLSNELRYIYWQGYVASPFPESFQATKLVILKIRGGLQKGLWKGCKYLPCLKELELEDAVALVRTPDFGGLPCLQKLILDGCVSLKEIHQSLGNHSSLVSVKVRNCDKLTRFPSIAGMEKLEILEISDCKALVEFPKIEAKMDNLVELYLEEVGIEVLPSSVGEYCTNLISLKLEGCSKLKSIEGNFHALKCLKKFELSACSQFEKLPKDLFNQNLDELHLLSLKSSSIKQLILSHFPCFLKRLNLGYCGLKDGEIPNEIGKLSNLQELDLSFNDFTRLDFSLSRLTSLKLLSLSHCNNLVELPELPSSLAILKAAYCWLLESVIRDEIHTNCKWLSQVSIWGWGLVNKKNIIGGERLLETMLQGNAVESRCMRLEVQGLEIARGFEPRLVKGSRCRMQLPENWFNDFSGFLFCAATSRDLFAGATRISMKHEEEEENGSWTGMGDSLHDDLHWEDSVDVDDDDDDKPIGKKDDSDDDDDGIMEWYTWVGYIPFSLLRHTSWWDPTSTAICIEIEDCFKMDLEDFFKMEFEDCSKMEIEDINGFGFKLVPKRGGGESSSSSGQMETTTTTHSSSSSEISLDDDDYKCKFEIEHDSKSELKCSFNPGGER